MAGCIAAHTGDGNGVVVCGVENNRAACKGLFVGGGYAPFEGVIVSKGKEREQQYPYNGECLDNVAFCGEVE